MRIGGIALDPAFRLRILRIQRLVVRRDQTLERIADLRIFCGSDLFFAVLRRPSAPERSADRHLHVGLSGTEPDFTDQNIVQHNVLFPVGDPDRVIGFSGFHGGKFRFPFAVVSGFCRNASAVEFDFDCRPFVSRSEKRDRLFLLKHHVRGEHGIHFEVRNRSGGKQYSRSECR